jgi:hypothetical protein
MMLSQVLWLQSRVPHGTTPRAWGLTGVSSCLCYTAPWAPICNFHSQEARLGWRSQVTTLCDQHCSSTSFCPAGS